MPEATNTVNYGMEYKYNFSSDSFSNPTEVKRCAEKNDDNNVVIDCDNMRKLIGKFKELVADNKKKKSVDSIDLFAEVDKWYNKLLIDYREFMKTPNGKKYSDVIDKLGNIIDQSKYYKMINSPEYQKFIKNTFSLAKIYQSHLDSVNVDCIYKGVNAEVSKVMIGKKILGRKSLVAVITYEQNNVKQNKFVDIETFCVIQRSEQVCST